MLAGIQPHEVAVNSVTFFFYFILTPGNEIGIGSKSGKALSARRAETPRNTAAIGLSYIALRDRLPPGGLRISKLSF